MVLLAWPACRICSQFISLLCSFTSCSRISPESLRPLQPQLDSNKLCFSRLFRFVFFFYIFTFIFLLWVCCTFCGYVNGRDQMTHSPGGADRDWEEGWEWEWEWGSGGTISFSATLKTSGLRLVLWLPEAKVRTFRRFDGLLFRRTPSGLVSPM